MILLKTHDLWCTWFSCLDRYVNSPFTFRWTGAFKTPFSSKLWLNNDEHTFQNIKTVKFRYFIQFSIGSSYGCYSSFLFRTNHYYESGTWIILQEIIFFCFVFYSFQLLFSWKKFQFLSAVLWNSSANFKSFFTEYLFSPVFLFTISEVFRRIAHYCI